MTDPGPVQVYVYDPVSQVAFGPYTKPPLDEDGTWWSTIIFGDTIGLEFHLPAEYTTPPSVLPRIVGALYCYKDLMGSDFYPQTGDCHTDLMCYPDWANSIEGRAIGRILIGSALCTSALINRNISDLSPIVMTARHCLSTQAGANTAVIIWFYQSQTCNGKNPPNLNTLPRNDGALLLKTDASSDWTLIGLYAPPGTNSYIGWDSAYLPNGASVVTIGHPAGLPKRIQFGTKTGDTTCLGTAGAFQMISTIGRGSGGDSGSPLYDASRRARGTLSCGPASCSTESNFGRLDIAFPEVRWYLFNPVNPTFVNRAVAGDPGNDGDTERGTSSNPFNTVYEATFCVPANGTVRIAPGNYNERFRVWRPMRLEREGTSGVVRIGAP
jgi:V8-like Glu-specific endopeptidase